MMLTKFQKYYKKNRDKMIQRSRDYRNNNYEKSREESKKSMQKNTFHIRQYLYYSKCDICQKNGLFFVYALVNKNTLNITYNSIRVNHNKGSKYQGSCIYQRKDIDEIINNLSDENKQKIYNHINKVININNG